MTSSRSDVGRRPLYRASISMGRRCFNLSTIGGSEDDTRPETYSKLHLMSLNPRPGSVTKDDGGDSPATLSYGVFANKTFLLIPTLGRYTGAGPPMNFSTLSSSNALRICSYDSRGWTRPELLVIAVPPPLSSPSSWRICWPFWWGTQAILKPTIDSCLKRLLRGWL